MLDGLVPSPAPWSPVWGVGSHLIIVISGGQFPIAVAACDGKRMEANAAMICAAPEMAAAILANDLVAARAALTSRGLA